MQLHNCVNSNKGLVKLRQSFVNNTDSDNTENAIGSLSNVINHGMEMVDHVLNQTTLYSVGENVDPVTTVLKLADQEVEEVKNYYFHNDTGKLILFLKVRKSQNCFFHFKYSKNSANFFTNFWTNL